jgi:uncharacterized membrane protein YeaQ/YmgE (transglycosylase-associated protein family)
MKIGPDEIVTWIIVGAIAGSLTGLLVKRRKQGFGGLLNLAIGLVGALIGGFLFKILRINIGVLSQISINLQEVVAGLIGSLIFLGIIALVRRQWFRRDGTQ